MELGNPIKAEREYRDDEIRYDALKTLREIMDEAQRANLAEEYEVAKRTFDALSRVPLKCRTHGRCNAEYDKHRAAVFGSSPNVWRKLLQYAPHPSHHLRGHPASCVVCNLSVGDALIGAPCGSCAPAASPGWWLRDRRPR